VLQFLLLNFLVLALVVLEHVESMLSILTFLALLPYAVLRWENLTRHFIGPHHAVDHFLFSDELLALTVRDASSTVRVAQVLRAHTDLGGVIIEVHLVITILLLIDQLHFGLTVAGRLLMDLVLRLLLLTPRHVLNLMFSTVQLGLLFWRLDHLEVAESFLIPCGFDLLLVLENLLLLAAVALLRHRYAEAHLCTHLCLRLGS